MSSSPFTAFENASLIFQVASGSLTPDSKGNLRPGTAVVELTAMLKQKSTANREPRPGVDTSAIYCEGYITSVLGQTSLVLPSVVTPDSPCQCVWQGRNGRFFLEFTARSPYLAALNIDLVEKLRGYFVPSSFVVTGDPWTPSPSPTPTPESQTLEAEADELILAGQPIYLKTSGHAAIASASSIGLARVSGVAVSTAAAGATVSYNPDGVVSLADWSNAIGSTELTPGATYFLSATAGRLTATAPTEPGQVVIAVGSAASTTQLAIEIQPPIIL